MPVPRRPFLDIMGHEDIGILWSSFIGYSIRSLQLFSRLSLITTLFGLPSCAIRFESTKFGPLPSLRPAFLPQLSFAFTK